MQRIMCAFLLRQEELKFKLLCVTMASIFLLEISHVGTAFSQTDSCQSHTLCVHTGNFLKYVVSFDQINGSQSFEFGKILDTKHIELVEKYTDGKNKTWNGTFVLNLGTGFIQNTQDSSLQKPFLEILSVPIQYNKTNPSTIQGWTNFNGFKRTSLESFQSSTNSTSRSEYDIETGILLGEHSIFIATIYGKPELVEFSERLVDTNIINSDSSDLQVSSFNIVIPNWVKNNAKWWSQDQIDDSEFVKAIQYLVTKKIIQVPHSPAAAISSHQIPHWIKSNAALWSVGKISDKDFVSGIQYLINVGIILV